MTEDETTEPEDLEAELAAQPMLRLYVRVGDTGVAPAKARMKADQAAAAQLLRRERVAVPIRYCRESLLTTSLIGHKETAT